MAIIETLSESQFAQRFVDYNRKENFSWKGLRALYQYLYNLSEDTQTPIEFDCIGLCCDFNETTWEEFKKEYPKFDDIADVFDHTVVIPLDDDLENPTFIYQVF